MNRAKQNSHNWDLGSFIQKDHRGNDIYFESQIGFWAIFEWNDNDELIGWENDTFKGGYDVLNAAQPKDCDHDFKKSDLRIKNDDGRIIHIQEKDGYTINYKYLPNIKDPYYFIDSNGYWREKKLPNNKKIDM